MSFWINVPNMSHDASSSMRMFDIVDGRTTATQRKLRREGLAGFAPTCTTLLTLFSRQTPGFTFLDVGAGIGLYSSLCALLYEPSGVVAFEPTPETAAMAGRLAESNGLDVALEQTALGDRSGIAELRLSPTSESSNSLREGFRESTRSVNVPLTTVDEYVSTNSIAPNVMKISAATYEPEVIAGARHTISEHRPTLVVEVVHREHDHGALITEAMSGLGYRYYRLAAQPEWNRRRSITSKPGSPHRYWLLTPRDLDYRFVREYRRMAPKVQACTASLNPGDPEASQPSVPGRLRRKLAARPLFR